MFAISAPLDISHKRAQPLYMALIAGLACAFVIGKALPVTMDAIATIVAPLIFAKVLGW